MRQSRPISWRDAWELLRRGEPTPPPAPNAALAARVRAALRGALQDELTENRNFAAVSLGRMGDLDHVARAVQRDSALRAGYGLLGPGFGAAISKEPERGKRVAEAVGIVLEDPAASVPAKVLAAFSLGLSGAANASALLRALEGTTDPTLRSGYLFALGLTGHPGGRELLVNAVRPPSGNGGRDIRPEVRALLTHALSWLPGDEVTTDLLKRLSDPSPLVQTAAASSLYSRVDKSPGVRQALRSVARAGAPRARSGAILALARAGDDTVPALARRILRDRVDRAGALGGVAAFCLGLVRSAEDVPGLLAILENRAAPKDLRCAAAVAVGLTRARGSSKELAEIVRKIEDQEVAAYGLIGLALVDGEAALPLARRLLVKAADERIRGIGERSAARRIRRVTVISLRYAGGAEAVELLVGALGDSYFVNQDAALALFRLDPERAVTELLARLADKKVSSARRFAMMSLGRAFERRTPSVPTEVLLGTGLGFRTGLEQVLLYFANECLFNFSGSR